METMETKVNTTNETESAAHQTGMMDINDFDYDLPEELIAQDPIEDVAVQDCFYWIKRQARLRIRFSEILSMN